MPHPSTAIANAFLTLPEVRSSGGLTQMQLQKLVYMAHGWNMVINGEPLVSDNPEAWTHGPVFRDLYEHTRSAGTKPITEQISPDDHPIISEFTNLDGSETKPYHAELSDREAAVIRNVWRKYGRLNGVALSRLTHKPNAPWFKAYTLKGKNAPITPDIIRPHYEELLSLGRAKRATTSAGT